jgi:hypothetical protein
MVLDTVNTCVGYGAQNLVYQKGDSFIYQQTNPIDTVRCYRYSQ